MQGGTINPQSVVLVCELSDGSTVEKHPDEIIVDTSVVGDAIAVTYIVNNNCVFNTTIKVVSQGSSTDHQGTLEDPYTVEELLEVYANLPVYDGSSDEGKNNCFSSCF